MLNKRSVIFAPMEGITDPIFRDVVERVSPLWDFQFTEFLRLPSVGTISSKRVSSFLGDNYKPQKNPFQILTNLAAATEDNFKTISNSEVLWLDLNFGCPSKKVCSHGGGASLMDHPKDLLQIVRIARNEFTGFLTAKIRIGVENDKNFREILKILEGEGVNAITVHPRTKKQMYKGHSSWEHIKIATKLLKIPVIGNGDILSPSDYQKMITKTGCHSVMIGRGALSNPWLPFLIKEDICYKDKIELFRVNQLMSLILEFKKREEDEKRLLIRLKQLTSYLFLGLPFQKELISRLLRSDSLQKYEATVQEYLC